jgi:hypothetical protein
MSELGEDWAAVRAVAGQRASDLDMSEHESRHMVLSLLGSLETELADLGKATTRLSEITRVVRVTAEARPEGTRS